MCIKPQYVMAEVVPVIQSTELFPYKSAMTAKPRAAIANELLQPKVAAGLAVWTVMGDEVVKVALAAVTALNVVGTCGWPSVNSVTAAAVEVT